MQLNLTLLEQYELTKALAELDLKPRSYSGRGMFGRECLGITVSGLSDTLAVAVVIGKLFASVENEFFSDARTDQMGKREILYFPQVAGWEGTEL